MTYLVPNSANKKANKCFGCLCNLKKRNKKLLPMYESRESNVSIFFIIRIQDDTRTKLRVTVRDQYNIETRRNPLLKLV